MKAIIQFNFTQGLGDLVVHQFELLNTSDYLKSIGYEIDLKLQLRGNAYFNEDMFFTYLNEDLILKLRFNILDKYVDYFIVIDGNITHSGEKKKKKF